MSRMALILAKCIQLVINVYNPYEILSLQESQLG